MPARDERVERAWEGAQQVYAALGVDAGKALSRLEAIEISLHCWQGDDVGGFETPDAALSGGGLQVTGSYPGKAGNVDELRQDLELVLSLLPGRHRVNLHAIYGEFGGRRVDRDEVAPEHFAGWVQWARRMKLKLDINGTFFSHPEAAAGFTLSSRQAGTRKFWIEHARRCRSIGDYMGRELGGPAINNIWIPDGQKDMPVDRAGYRRLLQDSLDEIFAVDYPLQHLKDSLESKLFGIGSESFVVGSHEFYTGYALTRKKMLCLDTGHFHPTESVADKISALLPFMEEGLLLHISRGIRWDSDHVVVYDDQLLSLAQEVVRAGALDRICLALDYFDASINRIAAYVIGARAARKAFLYALLEPAQMLQEMEEAGDCTSRLVLLDELKSKPWAAVWDYFCLRANTPLDDEWMEKVREYERTAERFTAAG